MAVTSTECLLFPGAVSHKTAQNQSNAAEGDTRPWCMHAVLEFWVHKRSLKVFPCRQTPDRAGVTTAAQLTSKASQLVLSSLRVPGLLLLYLQQKNLEPSLERRPWLFAAASGQVFGLSQPFTSDGLLI